MPLIAAFLASVVLTPAQAEPAGTRIDLGEATLFLPSGYRPAKSQVNIVLHLHGAAETIEPALARVGWPAALIEFNRKGLSRVYAEPFADPTLLPRLLDQTLKTIEMKGLAREPKVRKVVVSSFSAGFGGVRELLKVPEHFRRIDAIVMADSLYCGYQGDPAEHRVDPALMEGFTRFAREAAAGRKTLVLTHSALVPTGYASTAETADYLLAAVGAQSHPCRVEWGEGWVQNRRSEVGRFQVLGFEGAEGTDHMRHLRRIDAVWAHFPDPFQP